MNARPLATEVIAEAVYSGHYAPDYDMPWEPFPAPDALLTLVERRVPVPTRVTRQTAGEAGLLVVLDANTAFKVDDSTLGQAIGFPPPAAIAPMPVSGVGLPEPTVVLDLSQPSAIPFDQPDTEPSPFAKYGGVFVGQLEHRRDGWFVKVYAHRVMRLALDRDIRGLEGVAATNWDYGLRLAAVNGSYATAADRVRQFVRTWKPSAEAFADAEAWGTERDPFLNREEKVEV